MYTNNLDAKYSNFIAPISMFFYMILLVSSIGGQKLISFFNFTISSGTIIFPITYTIIAIITEIYGFKKAKIVIFSGAVCNLLVSSYLYFIIKLEPSPVWLNQESFEKTNLITSQILLNSTFAYVVSEYSNAKILYKLKVMMRGKLLILRALISTSLASVIDTLFMLPIIINKSPKHIFYILSSLILIKIIYSLILLPFLSKAVNFLRKREGIYANKTLMPFSSVSYMYDEKT